MKNNTFPINSLADVDKRLAEIELELAVCEEKMQETYFKFTHPFTWPQYLGEEECDNNENLSVLESLSCKAFKIRRLITFAGAAFSAYKFIRGLRK
ncbi:hypothetical protein LJC11_01435 [Bacteroidales bacterium OttesenSCG-928-I21]|nr:hypothetical protein [Bacteroidales bacterium OttesenSCG-928-I21]